MPTELQKILRNAFRGKAAIGLHVDLQEKYAGSIEQPHYGKAEELGISLRTAGLKNIWVVYNGPNSDFIEPQNYEPTGPAKAARTTHMAALQVPDEKAKFKIVKPQLPDSIISKAQESALGNRHLTDYLASSKPKLILVTGMYYDACIAQTIADGLSAQWSKTSNTHFCIIRDATDLLPEFQAEAETMLTAPIKQRIKQQKQQPVGIERLHIASVAEIQNCLAPAMAS